MISKLHSYTDSSLTANLDDTNGPRPASSTMDNLEFTRISFPSIPQDRFRVSVKASLEETILSTESRTTRQQWQVAVTDLRNHVSDGISLPRNIVLEQLEYALKLADEDSATSKKKPHDVTNGSKAVVDLIRVDGEYKFLLQFNISIRSIIEYSFFLLPVALEPCDVLAAQLRDANERIAQLEEANQWKRAFLSLTSERIGADKNHYIKWDGVSHFEVPHTHFALSADKTIIKAKQRGLYQIHIRASGNRMNQANHTLALLVNERVVSQCSEANDCSQFNGAQITDILELCDTDTVIVRCGMQYGSAGQGLESHNRLTILPLYLLE